MSSPRNVALLAAGGIGIAVIAFLSGRRVEADASGSAGHTNASATPLVSAHGPVAPSPSASTALAPASASANALTSAEDLYARLATEKTSRTKQEPSADTVFAGLKKKLGVEVDEEVQVAGWVVGARYCDKIRTKKDVHVVVCEFTDEAAAIQGVENGKSSVKNREVLRNKTSTCAVHVPGDDKASVAEAAKIKDLFRAL